MTAIAGSSGDWPLMEPYCSNEMCSGLWMKRFVVAPCGNRCFMNANFVCGKPFTCSFAFIAGRLGWATHVIGHLREWMRHVSVCVFMCVGGGRMRPDKWADHLFKPISLHPCSGMKIEYIWILTLVDFKGQGSLLSLLSEVEAINCAVLIFIESRHCLKGREDKLHQTANSGTVFFSVRRKTTSSKQRTKVLSLTISPWVQCFMLKGKIN